MNLFRTDPVLVNGAAVVSVLKDLDGADPVTLFVENMNLAASARTRFGSKNANLRFVAADAGETGNPYSVVFHAAVNQAFGIVVDAYVITVNLACDSDGKPYQMAYEVMDLMNEDAYVAAILRVVLAKGSDGSATMEVAVGTDATVTQDGGSVATTLGAVTVETSPTGHPDFAGPWTVNAAAGTALSTVGAGSVKSYSLAGQPTKGLRITAAKGASNTSIVVSAVKG